MTSSSSSFLTNQFSEILERAHHLVVEMFQKNDKNVLPCTALATKSERFIVGDESLELLMKPN
jgi:hypothetical protein